MLIALVATAALAGGGVEVAQLTIRSRVVVRVQTGEAPSPPPIVLRERRGPRCVPMTAIVGAARLADDSVDFVLRGGQRLRARFSGACPALDYYSGFYILPPQDGMICADRDVIRSRAGGDCAIDRFRRLVPGPPPHGAFP